MASCPRLYAILFHPRSGSSWLSSILASNSHFLHAYELLDRDTAVRDKYLSATESDHFSAHMQVSLIDRLVAHSEAFSRIQAVGFKFAPYQLINAALVVDYLRKRSFSVILIERRDLLATAVSQIGARRLASLNGQANVTDRTHQTRALLIEKDELIYYLTEQRLERDRVRSIAETFLTEKVFRMTYEEMVRRPRETVDSLATFLGVPIVYQEDVGIYKNLQKTLRKSISNIGDVIEWLRGSPYEACLAELDETR